MLYCLTQEEYSANSTKATEAAVKAAMTFLGDVENAISTRERFGFEQERVPIINPDKVRAASQKFRSTIAQIESPDPTKAP